MASNRGQITLFIILGIVIVVAIIALFLFYGKTTSEITDTTNPDNYIDKCVRDAVAPSIEKVLAGGGRVDPSFFSLYKSKKYNYLCYQNLFYLTCVNQYPQLKSIIEGEIMADSEARVKQCFANLKKELEDKKYAVSEGDFSWTLELAPKSVQIAIDKKMDINKNDNTQSFSKFKIRTLSPLYELAMIAREIVNAEAQYCNFEYNGFMILYPEYSLKRIDYDDNKIYILEDRLTGKVFKFAIRSCAFPPGL